MCLDALAMKITAHGYHKILSIVNTRRVNPFIPVYIPALPGLKMRYDWQFFQIEIESDYLCIVIFLIIVIIIGLLVQIHLKTF